MRTAFLLYVIPMANVELPDMGNKESVRKRGAPPGVNPAGLELEEPTTTDEEVGLLVRESERSVGSFSKEPKQRSAAASASSKQTTTPCIAAALILGGLFLVMLAGRGDEGALKEKQNRRGSFVLRNFRFWKDFGTKRGHFPKDTVLRTIQPSCKRGNNT